MITCPLIWEASLRIAAGPSGGALSLRPLYIPRPVGERADRVCVKGCCGQCGLLDESSASDRSHCNSFYSLAGCKLSYLGIKVPLLYATFPPTMVRSDSVFGISCGGTLKISCERTAKSANFPASRVPFSFSANSAYAAVRV